LLKDINIGIESWPAVLRDDLEENKPTHKPNVGFEWDHGNNYAYIKWEKNKYLIKSTQGIKSHELLKKNYGSGRLIENFNLRSGQSIKKRNLKGKKGLYPTKLQGKLQEYSQATTP
jgi:hypothetical protein